MQTRQLGNSELQVSALCFGGNVFGWTLDEKRSFSMLDACIETGLTFIDTADFYSRWAPGNNGGESETIIGNWIANGGPRDQIVLATKVGQEMGPGRTGLNRAHIMQSVEESLKRLHTDYIDLYQAHRDDDDVTQDETMEAFGRLVSQGKVRVLGASNFDAPRLDSAAKTAAELSVPTYQCLQPLYNLIEREPFEARLQEFCLANQIGVIPYYSLASGFLSGKYRNPNDASLSARGSGVIERYLNDTGIRVLAALDQISQQTGATHSAIAIAWLIAQPAITAPIVSATNRQQLDELLAGADLTLEADHLAQLDAASQWR